MSAALVVALELNPVVAYSFSPTVVARLGSLAWLLRQIGTNVLINKME